MLEPSQLSSFKIRPYSPSSGHEHYRNRDKDDKDGQNRTKMVNSLKLA